MPIIPLESVGGSFRTAVQGGGVQMEPGNVAEVRRMHLELERPRRLEGKGQSSREEEFQESAQRFP